MRKGKNYQIIVINTDDPSELFQADIKDVHFELKAETEWVHTDPDGAGYHQEIQHKCWHLFLNGEVKEFEMQVGENA